MSLPYDPFFVSHPVLNWRYVTVTVEGRPFGAFGTGVTRKVDWSALTSEERLELERLLAKAAKEVPR